MLNEDEKLLEQARDAHAQSVVSKIIAAVASLAMVAFIVYFVLNYFPYGR